MKRKFVFGGVTGSGITWRSEVWREVPDDFDDTLRIAAALKRLASSPPPDSIMASSDFLRSYREATQ